MRISINIVRHLMAKVEALGYGDLLRQSQDYTSLEQLPADTMVDAEVFLRIIGHVEAHYPGGRMAYDIEYKNFSLGQINMLGALGQLVQVSPTLQNVSEAFYQYYGKLNSIFSPGIERRGEYMASKITTGNPELWKLRPFQVCVEMFLYGTIRIVKEWFEPDLAHPISLTLPYPLPAAERQVMNETVGIEPLLGDGCYLLFKAEAFLKPLPFANPQLWGHLKNYLEQTTQSEHAPFRTQLEEYIKSNIRHMPDLETAARHFSLSERSLQRRLKAENVSFQQVVDSVRKAIACRLLLADRLGLKEIAFECGFADPNSFFKAFKKWTGQTPEQWKANH